MKRNEPFDGSRIPQRVADLLCDEYLQLVSQPEHRGGSEAAVLAARRMKIAHKRGVWRCNIVERDMSQDEKRKAAGMRMRGVSVVEVCRHYRINRTKLCSIMREITDGPN